MRFIDTIVVHCSDTETGTVESIRRFHMAPPPKGRGFSDIGYHYVIERDGALRLGRPEATIGAHCKGHNKTSIGICLVGKSSFTDAQFKTLRLTVASLRDHFDSIKYVKGHREFDTAKAQGKTCPNFDVEAVLGVNWV